MRSAVSGVPLTAKREFMRGEDSPRSLFIGEPQEEMP